MSEREREKKDEQRQEKDEEKKNVEVMKIEECDMKKKKSITQTVDRKQNIYNNQDYYEESQEIYTQQDKKQ